MRRRIALAAVAALLAAPSLHAQEQIVEAFVAAFNSADVDALVRLHSPTGVRLPPYEPPVMGHEALRDHFREQLTEYAFVQLSAQQDGQHVAESFAVSWGTYELNVIPESGAEEFTETGHWVSIAREQYGSGEWLIERTIWNADSPPPDG
jgi:ketosteroid isomerase-like protein